MPNNRDIQIIESVGIEMEISDIDRNNRALVRDFNSTLPQYKRAHDASCETPAYFIDGLPMPINFGDKDDKILLKDILYRTILGGEIISPICDTSAPDWVTDVRNLCEILVRHGETENSVRDSFHVHVNLTRQVPLFVLKNLLKLEASFEAIIFRLSGMGRENRGQENHYCFCRPFLGNGPPVIQMKGLYPITSYEELMNTDTVTEFFDKFGSSNYHAARNNRYVTQRYMCVNFYPILTQGSFEFRTANKTLVPEYIIAWTNFCKAFVEKAFSPRGSESFEKIHRPLYENREISSEEFIDAISTLSSLDEDSISILLEIWEKSPTPYFDNVWRFSHLRNPTKFAIVDHATNPLPKNTLVEDAVFLDIHHFEEDFDEVDEEIADRPRRPRILNNRGTHPIRLGEFGDLTFSNNILLQNISPNYTVEVNYNYGVHEALRHTAKITRENPAIDVVRLEIFGQNNNLLDRTEIFIGERINLDFIVRQYVVGGIRLANCQLRERNER